MNRNSPTELHVLPRLRRLDRLLDSGTACAAILRKVCRSTSAPSASYWLKAADSFLLALVAADKAARIYGELLNASLAETAIAVEHMMAMDAAADAADAAAGALNQAVFAVSLAMGSEQT